VRFHRNLLQRQRHGRRSSAESGEIEGDDEEESRDLGPSSDLVLSGLVDLLNNIGSRDLDVKVRIGITLVVGGATLTGTLVNAGQWFEKEAALARAAVDQSDGSTCDPGSAFR
jgi:hypothetical protein